MHYRLARYFDEHPLGDDREEIMIRCEDEETYNRTLDALSKFTEENVNVYGTSRADTEIVVERDPRLGYRKFDEKHLIDSRIEDE